MQRATNVLAKVLVFGAVAWLVKVALIAANGGANTDQGIVAVFFGLGALGLLVGSSSLGLWLLRRRHVLVQLLAALTAIACFWVTFGLVDQALQAAIGDAGPRWLDEEAGIVVVSVAWLAIGAWLVRRSGRERVAFVGG